MRNLKLLSLLTVGAIGILAACGDSGTTSTGTGGGTTTSSTGGNGTGGTTTSAGGGGSGGGTNIPTPPELGAQIDRMGRPAINTALDDTFVYVDGNGAHPSNDTVRAASEDAYNEDSQPNMWVANHAQSAGIQLAVLDSLDTGLDLDGAGPNPPLTNAQACSNGFASCNDSSDGSGNCYATIAAVLASDRLWVDSGGTDCGASEPVDPVGGGYLAVEINYVLPGTNTDCGGRRPADDVIDKTYSAVAIGLPGGFGDNIAEPAGLHPEAFPYLAPPH
jgi:hypothetical protein